MLGGFLKTCKNATSSTIVILIWPKNCLKIKCYCDKPPLWWSVCFFRVIYPFTAPTWLWIVLPVGQFKLYLQFNFQIRDLSFIRGGGGRRAGAILFSLVHSFMPSPNFLQKKCNPPSCMAQNSYDPPHTKRYDTDYKKRLTFTLWWKEAPKRHSGTGIYDHFTHWHKLY